MPKATQDKKKSTSRPSSQVAKKSISKSKGAAASDGDKLEAHQNFKSYLKKIIKNVKPNLSIDGSAMGTLNTLTLQLMEHVGRTAAEITKTKKQKTLSDEHIKVAIKDIMGSRKQACLEYVQSCIENHALAKEKPEDGDAA